MRATLCNSPGCVRSHSAASAMLIPSPPVALLPLSAGRRNGSLRIGHAAFSQCRPNPDLPPWMMYHVPMYRVPCMKLARLRAKLQCASIGGGFNTSVIAFERFLAMQSRGHRSATWYTPKPFRYKNRIASEIRLATLRSFACQHANPLFRA